MNLAIPLFIHCAGRSPREKVQPEAPDCRRLRRSKSGSTTSRPHRALDLRAGDDASPLVRLGRELGWFVSLAMALSSRTRERFPQAIRCNASPSSSASRPEPTTNLGPFHAGDVAIVMTHSFEQDSRILASLLGGPNPSPISGPWPQRRTRELLIEPPICSTSIRGSRSAGQDLAQPLHAPTGLDLGRSARTIALSILAEIQKTLTGSPECPSARFERRNRLPDAFRAGKRLPCVVSICSRI